jgi:hypothetical protein
MMIVDDHAINSLKVYYDVACDELKKEWNSNEYRTIRECPSFKAVYTYREALDVLIKGPGHIDEDRVERLKETVIE